MYYVLNFSFIIYFGQTKENTILLKIDGQKPE